MKLDDGGVILIAKSGSHLTTAQVDKIHCFWYCSEGWCDMLDNYLTRRKKITTRAWMLAVKHPSVIELFLERGYSPKPSLLPYLITYCNSRNATIQLLLQQLPNVDGEVQELSSIIYPSIMSLKRRALSPRKVTALECAVFKDNIELVGQLLALGANPNFRRSSDGNFSLFFVKSHAMMTLLLEAGADPTLKNNRGQTILYHHIRNCTSLIPEIIKLVDVNSVDEDGNNCIICWVDFVTFADHTKSAIKLLREAGLDFYHVNKEGKMIFDLCSDRLKPYLLGLQ